MNDKYLISNNEEEQEEAKNSSIPLPISKHLFDSRMVLITGEVSQQMAREICSQLFAMAAVSSDPILVVVSSPGGHVESGDMIHDTIKFITPRVRILGSGWVASAGALIYIAAEKEDRYVLPNTRFLLHQPSGGAGGRATDIAIHAREILKTKARLNMLFAEATGQSVERIEADTERDHWMSAEEAVEYGLATHIISTQAEIL